MSRKKASQVCCDGVQFVVDATPDHVVLFRCNVVDGRLEHFALLHVPDQPLGVVHVVVGVAAVLLDRLDRVLGLSHPAVQDLEKITG